MGTRGTCIKLYFKLQRFYSNRPYDVAQNTSKILSSKLLYYSKFQDENTDLSQAIIFKVALQRNHQSFWSLLQDKHSGRTQETEGNVGLSSLLIPSTMSAIFSGYALLQALRRDGR